MTALAGQGIVDYVEVAEKILRRLDPADFQTDADIIAYAQALLALSDRVERIF